MKCGEDEANERKNGDTAVSSGHSELGVWRRSGHGGGDGHGQ